MNELKEKLVILAGCVFIATFVGVIGAIFIAPALSVLTIFSFRYFFTSMRNGNKGDAALCFFVGCVSLLYAKNFIKSLFDELGSAWASIFLIASMGGAFFIYDYYKRKELENADRKKDASAEE